MAPKSIKRFFGALSGKNKAPEHVKHTAADYLAREQAHYNLNAPATSETYVPRSQQWSPLPSNFNIDEDSSDPSSGTWGSDMSQRIGLGTDTSDPVAFHAALKARSPVHSLGRPTQDGRRASSQPSVASSYGGNSRASRRVSKDPNTAKLQLYRFCKTGDDIEIVRRALNQVVGPAEPNTSLDPEREEVITTCVVITASTENTEVMEELVRRGGSVSDDVRSEERRTLLHIAAIHGCVSMCQWLINHGANVDAKDDFGRTPDQLAFQSGQAACGGFIEGARRQLQMREVSLLTPGLAYNDHNAGDYIQPIHTTTHQMYYHQTQNQYSQHVPSISPQSLPDGVWTMQYSNVQY